MHFRSGEMHWNAMVKLPRMCQHVIELNVTKSSNIFMCKHFTTGISNRAINDKHLH